MSGWAEQNHGKTSDRSCDAFGKIADPDQELVSQGVSSSLPRNGASAFSSRSCLSSRWIWSPSCTWPAFRVKTMKCVSIWCAPHMCDVQVRAGRTWAHSYSYLATSSYVMHYLCIGTLKSFYTNLRLVLGVASYTKEKLHWHHFAAILNYRRFILGILQVVKNSYIWNSGLLI